MRKILFPIILTISLLGGGSHETVTSIEKDNRFDKLNAEIAEIKKEEEETKRKERERIAEKQQQAQLAARQKPQESQQKQIKSNDLDGDGFIGQYEWPKMSSGEQKQWTKDFTECVDSGKDDCGHE